ncbi:dihydrodipicolinate synthase family protein [uncultured Halomonas sp.]|uniref:dihydrodipicolinate synthase family protein n=1 Tax=uncultured Halomonas sp. TaxID=173971 RepID=UPI00260F5F31|nr:dihydrodipicolinate synthase family protein [uncultured Halomonas sp.]
MLTGLSAFPLTPMNEQTIDEVAFVGLIERLAAAGVDSIGVLGSTGNYAYLTRDERARVPRLAVAHAGEVPVIVGISALRTREVLALAEDAEASGASAVLLAPMSYQPLSDEEVFGLYQDATARLSVPMCVYDNPGTTHFTFSDELHGRIAQLPGVASIKIPGVPVEPEAARERVERLRTLVPAGVTIGVSGDPMAAIGLNAGCDAWHSVIGGLFPETALAITRTAQAGRAEEALRLSQRLESLWALFRQHGGSLRVVATAAELSSLAESPSLPLPLKTLEGRERQALAALLEELALA